MQLVAPPCWSPIVSHTIHGLFLLNAFLHENNYYLLLQRFPIRSSTFRRTKKLCGAYARTKAAAAKGHCHPPRPSGCIPWWRVRRHAWYLPLSRPRLNFCVPDKRRPRKRRDRTCRCGRNFDSLSKTRVGPRPCTVDCDPRCGGMCRFRPFIGCRWNSVK